MAARKRPGKRVSLRKPVSLSHPPPPQPTGIKSPPVLLLLSAILLCACVIVCVPSLKIGVQAGWARLVYEVEDAAGVGWKQLPMHPLEVIEWPSSNLHPNRCQVFDGEWVRIPQTIICINSDGFRDHEYSVAKPADTTRIILLGDSFAFGWGVELEDSLPKQLEGVFDALVDGDVEVLNFGVPGVSISPEVNFLEDTGLKYNPDYVLIYFVSNDFENSQEAHAISERIIEAYLLKYPGATRAKAEAQTINIVQRELNKNFAKENLTSLRTTFFPTLRRLQNHAQQKNFTTIFLLIQDSYFENQREFIEQMSDELGFDVLYVEEDTHPDYNPLRMTLHPRDGHPTAFANRIKAELLADELLERYPELSS